MAENRFKQGLTKELKQLFPGCYILRNDANYLQGVPDILILWGRHWATLEAKDYESAPERPNQRYHVEMMDQMSFSAFIHPENKEEVFHALQHAFESCRCPRYP